MEPSPLSRVTSLAGNPGGAEGLMEEESVLKEKREIEGRQSPVLFPADVIGVSRLTSVLITVYHAAQTLSRLRSTAVGGVALTESAQRDTPLDFLVI